MVGNDPRHDIAPARALGLKAVLLAASTPAYHEADAVIHDLSELPALLA